MLKHLPWPLKWLALALRIVLESPDGSQNRPHPREITVTAEASPFFSMAVIPPEKPDSGNDTFVAGRRASGAERVACVDGTGIFLLFNRRPFSMIQPMSTIWSFDLGKVSIGEAYEKLSKMLQCTKKPFHLFFSRRLVDAKKELTKYLKFASQCHTAMPAHLFCFCKRARLRSLPLTIKIL